MASSPLRPSGDCARGPNNCRTEVNPDRAYLDGDQFGDVCDDDNDTDGADDVSHIVHDNDGTFEVNHVCAKTASGEWVNPINGCWIGETEKSSSASDAAQSGCASKK